MARGATLVDEWIQEGQEAGREEGRIQARRDDLRALLERNFGVLPKPVVRRVEAIQEEKRLLELMMRVLDARALDEVGV